jgi:hypothetical protein
MPASLSPVRVAQYERSGRCFPGDCRTAEEIRSVANFGPAADTLFSTGAGTRSEAPIQRPVKVSVIFRVPDE